MRNQKNGLVISGVLRDSLTFCNCPQRPSYFGAVFLQMCHTEFFFLIRKTGLIRVVLNNFMVFINHQQEECFSLP